MIFKSIPLSSVNFLAQGVLDHQDHVEIVADVLCGQQGELGGEEEGQSRIFEVYRELADRYAV